MKPDEMRKRAERYSNAANSEAFEGVSGRGPLFEVVSTILEVAAEICERLDTLIEISDKQGL